MLDPEILTEKRINMFSNMEKLAAGLVNQKVTGFLAHEIL